MGNTCKVGFEMIFKIWREVPQAWLTYIEMVSSHGASSFLPTSITNEYHFVGESCHQAHPLDNSKLCEAPGFFSYKASEESRFEGSSSTINMLSINT